MFPISALLTKITIFASHSGDFFQSPRSSIIKFDTFLIPMVPPCLTLFLRKLWPFFVLNYLKIGFHNISEFYSINVFLLLNKKIPFLFQV